MCQSDGGMLPSPPPPQQFSCIQYVYVQYTECILRL
jgi:hypothetical protein